LGLAWGPAWVLGAAVAPTDATAVGVLARVPRLHTVTVLRAGEIGVLPVPGTTGTPTPGPVRAGDGPPDQTDEECRELIEELTSTVRRVTGAPLDKIVVYVQEIPQNRWGEGGTLGSNPEFAELSRRRS